MKTDPTVYTSSDLRIIKGCMEECVIITALTALRQQGKHLLADKIARTKLPNINDQFTFKEITAFCIASGWGLDSLYRDLVFKEAEMQNQLLLIARKKQDEETNKLFRINHNLAIDYIGLIMRLSFDIFLEGKLDK